MSTLKNGQIGAAVRLQSLAEPEIDAYVSSLKRDYRQYELPLSAGRKLIDESLKSGVLTDILYESREH